MRIALLSDIHGNPLALDAVLRDVESRGGVDEYWILGDLASLGYDPLGVLERVAALPNARFTRGNTDRYIVTGERPMPSLADAARDPRLLPRLIEVASSFSWTQGAVTTAGWRDWLADLPLEYRAVLPDGTRVLCVHSAPGTDDGAGVLPMLSDAEMKSLLIGADADLIFVAHTHWAFDKSVDGARVVNLGSVSNPLPPDLRASYVWLDADASGHWVEHRRVEYDRDAVIAETERVGHPAAHYIARFMRGERKPFWQA